MYHIQGMLTCLHVDPSLDGEEKLTELKLSLAMNARHLSKCGNPPRTLTDGYNRAEARGKKATHRLGQGGRRRFRGDFISSFLLLLLPFQLPLPPPFSLTLSLGNANVFDLMPST